MFIQTTCLIPHDQFCMLCQQKCQIKMNKKTLVIVPGNSDLIVIAANYGIKLRLKRFFRRVGLPFIMLQPSLAQLEVIHCLTLSYTECDISISKLFHFCSSFGFGFIQILGIVTHTFLYHIIHHSLFVPGFTATLIPFGSCYLTS